MNEPSSTGAAIIRSPLLQIVDSAPAGRSSVERLLREQQTLTAVDRFSKRHDEAAGPAQARYYRDLIPLERPRPGQQYAFEVDLDVCTGCKACVAACHSLNGLDETEVWRTVGLLHGGSADAPAQQTVTSSCHHCVEPACMAGCPVKAYEKDPVTGIVKHLDDQCIGCQYCTLMCPYDAPKYSKAKGIVRKCDMCTDRLAVGEAPACVQGCPNGAIKIRVVDQVQAVQASEAGAFLPGAPAPDHTVPTTVYKSGKPIPKNMLPADFYAVSPEHPHAPLVLMLVLTQLSVGAFLVDLLLGRTLGAPAIPGWGLAQAAFSLTLAGVALAAATLHLGRPLYAFRAILGLRTSWMSREILSFGLFAKAGAVYAAALAPQLLPAFPGKALLVGAREELHLAAAGAGLLGVLCSAMIYGATKRAHWRAPLVNAKFFGTTLLLGAASAWALLAAAAAWTSAAGETARAEGLLLRAVLGVAAAKLAFELAVFRHLGDRRHTVMKRVALLMIRDLRRATIGRFVAGLVGGIVLPLVGLLRFDRPPAALAVAAFLLLLAGELLERYLFFKAAPASRMPGGLS